jgi:carbon-monoxide dehydrogenase small subunit
VKSRLDIALKVNGEDYEAEVEARMTLADFLRTSCRLTGTHLGCEQGVCGACTVIVDGEAVRSCLMFAVQAHGTEIVTIEGLAPDSHTLHPIQQAFREAHGLQCGFCTPGIIMSLAALLERDPHQSEDDLREGLSGNLCRCTGYQGILRAAKLAARRMAQ